MEELDSGIARVQNHLLWYQQDTVDITELKEKSISEECWMKLAAGSLQRPQMSGEGN